MSYDNTNFGLTASGFPVLPYYGISDNLVEKKFENEAEKTIQKNKHAYQLAKLTSHATTPRQYLNCCIRIVTAKLMDSAIKRYCKVEELPSSLSLCLWDADNFNIILLQYINALGIENTMSRRKELDDLISKIIRNKEAFSVYERVGFIRSFLTNAALIHPLNKDLMRQVLSTSRLFLNVIDVKGREGDYLIEQKKRNFLLIENEEKTTLPSYRGKRFIKNWKKRHLIELMAYASQYNRDAYFELLALLESGQVLDLKEKVNDILMRYMPLI